MEIKDQHIAKLLLVYASNGTTLVCTDKNHYKFWNITLNNDGTIITTWGRIGNKPQSLTLPASAFPQHIIQKAIYSKLRKGYEIFSDNRVLK